MSQKVEANAGSFKAVIITLMLFSGAINTLAYKFQNKQFVNQGPYYKYFFHPYMQATTMFFGQFLVLFGYFFLRKRNPEKYKMDMLQARSKGKQINMNKFLLAIPAFCDFVNSTLQYIALNFISGSVYQMLRGGTIITTTVLSVFFLKTKILKHQYVGCALAFIGVFIVGFSSLAFADDSGSGASSGLQIMGYVLVGISLFFNGFFFVFQQKLFTKYHLDPLEVVGYQGMFGFVIYLVCLPILSFIPCTFGKDACVFSEQGFPFMQKPMQYFTQAFSSTPLLIFCILGIFSIATFNITGVTVTKHINALARSLGDVTRTILVWGIGLLITATAGVNYPNYRWQLLNGWAILVQLIGFAVLIFGNLVYNQIVKLPGKKRGDQALLSDYDQESDKQQSSVITSGNQIKQNQ